MQVAANNTQEVSNQNSLNADPLPTEVVKTNETKELIIPVLKGQEDALQTELKDLQQRYSELVSQQFNIPIEKILSCAPQNIVFKPEDSPPITKSKKSSKKSKHKYNLQNWQEVSNVDDLKSLKMVDLKNILASKELACNGSKSQLMARVWGILHPDQAPEEPKRKGRGRPKGSGSKTQKAHHIVNDSEGDNLLDPCDNDITISVSDDIEEILNTGVEKELSNSEMSGDSKSSVTVIESKGWVFDVDDEGNMEWLGTINDDGTTYSEADLPAELQALYE